MLKSFMYAGIAVMSFGLASSALAAVNLSTGTDTDGDGVDDTWTVESGPISGPAFIPANIVSTYAAPANRWITPRLGNEQGINSPATVPEGVYNFKGVVNLSSITSIGSWVTWKGNIFSDNSIVDILVNGTSMGFSSTGFGSGTPFSFSFNALSGNNTFVIKLNNASGGGYNPAALRVDQTSLTAAVPEPGTWLLMILGLGAVGFAMRRRQAATVRYQFS